MIASRIKGVRKKAGDTQFSLAERLGVAQRTVSNWETGINEPPYVMLIKIADIYGVTTDYLLDRAPLPNLYAYPVGDINRLPTTMYTDEKDMSDERKRELVEEVQGPGAIVLKKPDKLPTDREELKQLVRDMIEEAMNARDQASDH